MLIAAGQTIAVGLIVGAATLYLGWCLWRSLTGKGGGLSCCDSKTCPSGSQEPEPTRPAGEKQFVPSENLADLARRLKEKERSRGGETER